MIINENGVTVRELKEFIKNLPEKDHNGEDFTVWVGEGTISNYVTEIWTLNMGDILLKINER